MSSIGAIILKHQDRAASTPMSLKIRQRVNKLRGSRSTYDVKPNISYSIRFLPLSHLAYAYVKNHSYQESPAGTTARSGD